MTSDDAYLKLVSLIDLGKTARKEDYHESHLPTMEYIAGPTYYQWLSEVQIFNGRYLKKKEHPLSDEIQMFCSKKDQLISSYEALMGILEALVSDDELWEEDSGEETIKENNTTKERHKKMIFISHATDDKAFTAAFVELLYGIGLNEDDIVCSSYPGAGIPLGSNAYKWLVEKFQKCDLHIIYFLSHNYYDSAASLNEMGAAWALKQKWDGILLPGFEFADIKGCIDADQISIKLDGDEQELKHRLGELKDNIAREFGTRIITSTRWEKIRDEFIEKVSKIEPESTETDNTPLNNTEHNTGDTDRNLSGYASVMLLYAAESNGRIIVVQTLNGTGYGAGNYSMERDQTPRELAKWDNAVNQLLSGDYIKCVGKGVYEVTAKGYDFSDAIKKDNDFDLGKSPSEMLAEFGED